MGKSKITVSLLANHWVGNARIQRAANNNPPLLEGESDHAAVKLLQEALIGSGFSVGRGADVFFGPRTAAAVIAMERHFGFPVDAGIAGREVLGALDLTLRGWAPQVGAFWGGLIAKTIVPLAQRKVNVARSALDDIRTMLSFGSFDFVTADGVTMVALTTYFKLVPPGGTKQLFEEFITIATIDPLIANYRGLAQTLANDKTTCYSICTLGLDVAAKAVFGGPILIGPPCSAFKLAPVTVTNIDKTGPNSIAAIMMHEGIHVVDIASGQEGIPISEFEVAYETQTAEKVRHNPSAYATFAAHMEDGNNRPRD
jgi:peptidoglycan hydrolase-like protein with peptidoglycan-binding domain